MPISGAWGQYPDIDEVEDQIRVAREWYEKGLTILNWSSDLLTRAKLTEYMAHMKLRKMLEEESAKEQVHYEVKEIPFVDVHFNTD